VPLFVLRLGLPSSLAAWRVPISVIIMDAILAFIAVIGIRLLRRVLWERYERLQTEPVRGTRKRPTLLIGAGRAGLLSVREILGRHDTDMEVRGFIDDDAQKQGSMIHGVRVLGSTLELEKFVRALQIEQVVITIAQAPRTEVAPAARSARSCAVRSRASRRASSCSSSARSPRCSTSIASSATSRPWARGVLPLLADVGDEPRMRGIFERAPARRRVPRGRAQARADDGGQPLRGDQEQRARHARRRRARDRPRRREFVLVSTDKAVNPTSIMGASKRLAEMSSRGSSARAARASSRCASATCSAHRQRDPDLPRADRARRPRHGHAPRDDALLHDDPRGRAARAAGRPMGEGGEIFVLDMGEPVKIVDLAKRDDHALRAPPRRRHRIQFTGLRPGEKLFEELESIVNTKHPKVFIGKIATVAPVVVARALEELRELIDRRDSTALRARISVLLPEAQIAPKRASHDAEPAAARLRPRSSVEVGDVAAS
jgi:FlaA1/EpsC-like NDP-sugar epimerase